MIPRKTRWIGPRPADDDLWPKVERAASIITAVAGAVGAVAVAGKAIVEWVQARETAKKSRDGEEP